ncbi:HEPN domain-containing protein [Pontiellaceae bacterium B12219]|nr:HEPN domain-containing protein [Pontiellaceae bacterium B12219]
MVLNYKTLKSRHREIRDGQPEAIRLRIHRALSWLKAAEQSDQADTRFIFLWITFNSIYAQEFNAHETFGEKGLLNRFLGQLVKLDAENLIHKIAWDNYSGKIRLFIDNPYCSRYFWNFHNGRLTEEQWKKKFEQSRRDAQRALAIKDTTIFCTILFDRLYVLRNQLMHGGATWKSDINRAQVKDGTRILEQIIPAMIYIMMENADEEWGSPCFPPIS